MEKNQEINRYKSLRGRSQPSRIFNRWEFPRRTDSFKLFKVNNAYEMAQKIQKDVYDQTGIYTTIGIGDNLLS